MSTPRWPVYATQPLPLEKQIDDLLRQAPAPTQGDAELVGLIVPDSNRLAGGRAAAAAYRLLQGQDIDTVLLISPSHTESFGRLTICSVDAYFSPLGTVPVNDTLRNELCDEDDDIFLDDRGHFHTEGADVQVPFLLRMLRKPFDIVPIVMGEESNAFCKELGHALGEVLYGRRALVVATADVLAVEPNAFARFVQAIDAFNVSDLLHLLGGDDLQIDGIGALVVAFLAAQVRGADRAELLHYDPPTNGEMGALSIALWRT